MDRKTPVGTSGSADRDATAATATFSSESAGTGQSLFFEAAERAEDGPRFLCRGGAFTALLGSNQVDVLLMPFAPAPDLPPRVSQLSSYRKRRSFTGPGPSPRPGMVRISLVNSKAAIDMVAEGAQPGKVNYLLGSDPGLWRQSVPRYARVRCCNVYSGVDWIHHTEGSRLKSDFVVAAGTDPSCILLRFEGAQHLEIDAAGDLIVRAAAGTWRQPRPLIYQEVDGERREVAGGYVLKNADQVGFAVAGHDVRRPLIIDPVLVFCSYAGDQGQNMVAAIAVDPAGNVYITGPTHLINTTPPHALLETYFVTKLTPAGAVIYNTFLGGTGAPEGLVGLTLELSGGIAVDAAGNAYVTGMTTSKDFPVVNAFQPLMRGSASAFVCKLNPMGTAPVYSTFLGGSKGGAGFAIAVDAIGSAHVVGNTNSPDFPVVGAFQNAKKGNIDVFVTKFNALGNQVIYSTFLGGTGDEDIGMRAALDSVGNLVVVGITSSSDFPIKDAFQGAKKGTTSAFITKLNAAGSQLVFSTFLGGSGSMEQGATGVALDAQDNIYITGATSSTDFPVAHPLQGSQDTDPHVFVTKLSADGRTLVYSTYLGTGNSAALGIAVNASGAAHVTGWTTSGTFPAINAFQATRRGQTDAFVVKLNSEGSAILYSSYLGGSKVQRGLCIAVDSTGNVFAGGLTTSLDFPRVNAFQPLPSSDQSSGFVVRIGDPGVLAFAQASYDVRANSGSIQVVVLRAAGSIAVSVDYATQPGTAVPELDYLPTSGTLSFAPGENNKAFTVVVNPSVLPRGDRTVRLRLSNATGGAVLGNNADAVLTIHDPPGAFQFESGAATFQDNAGAVGITVRRVGGVGAATVNFATADGTAVAGTDYQATSGTLLFGPNDMSKDIQVTILSDPQAAANRTLTLQLSNPSAGASLGSPQRMFLVISHS